MFLVASLHLAFRHFGTRETLGCSRVDKSQVQKVKLRHPSENSTRSGETPLTRVETRLHHELSLYVMENNRVKSFYKPSTILEVMVQTNSDAHTANLTKSPLKKLWEKKILVTNIFCFSLNSEVYSNH